MSNNTAKNRPSVLLTDYAWANLDIERETLERAGIELVVAEKSDAESLGALAFEHQVDAIMTNWAKVPASVIAASPKVKIVSRLGIGIDNIDVEYCTAHGIPVTNIPDYCIIEVAEHALALLFALSRKVAFYHHATKEGRYELQAGPVLRRIEGQTLGIIGFGNIGRCLADKARCLGLKILAYNRSPKQEAGVEFVDLDTLLARSDYVSLHLPANADSKNLMNAERLAKMKPTAYLINTARGAVVDERALAEAIASGHLAGAALDVQQIEPPDLKQSPYHDPRVIVTPHAAFVSQESLENLRRRTAQQIVDRLAGRVPENVRNGVAL
jgi:D-3-phosphoglycerate dehydrogenase